MDWLLVSLEIVLKYQSFQYCFGFLCFYVLVLYNLFSLTSKWLAQAVSKMSIDVFLWSDTLKHVQCSCRIHEMESTITSLQEENRVTQLRRFVLVVIHKFCTVFYSFMDV